MNYIGTFNNRNYQVIIADLMPEPAIEPIILALPLIPAKTLNYWFFRRVSTEAEPRPTKMAEIFDTTLNQ